MYKLFILLFCVAGCKCKCVIKAFGGAIPNWRENSFAKPTSWTRAASHFNQEWILFMGFKGHLKKKVTSCCLWFVVTFAVLLYKIEQDVFTFMASITSFYLLIKLKKHDRYIFISGHFPCLTQPKILLFGIFLCSLILSFAHIMSSSLWKMVDGYLCHC